MSKQDFTKFCGWRPGMPGTSQRERIACYRQIEAHLNDPENKHPVFGVSARHVIDSYEKQDTYLWQALLWCNPNYRRAAQGIGDCFAPDTLVFGPDDTKPIRDVQIGDRVFAGNGGVTTVISKQVKRSYQPMVTIHTTGGIPLRVTADHLVLAYRFEFVCPKQKKRVTKAFYGRVNKGNRSRGPSTVVSAYEGRKAEWVKAADLRESDYLLTPLVVERGERPKHALLSDDDGRWVFGYFLGDGNASGGSVEFAVADEAIAARIVNALVRIGYNPKRGEYRKGCGAFRIRVHNVELVRWLRKHCYGHDKLKLMPSWAIGDTAVADGLLAADRTKAENRIEFNSVSPSLALGMQATLLMQGYDATMTVVRRSKGSYRSNRKTYRVIANTQRSRQRIWRDDKWLCRPIRKIEVTEGPHEVYDIGVEDREHAFVANGYVAHNCVSWGSELACTLLTAKEAFKRKRKAMYVEVATEPIYGGSRCEISGWWGKTSDGSFGSAAAQWVKKYGVVWRTDYSKETGDQSHDLRTYSSSKAKNWGANGCGGGGKSGTKLDDVAKRFPCKAVSQVNNFEDVAAAIAGAKCPVTIASMYGTSMKRNQYGECGWSGSWAHQMMLAAVRFGERPGAWCCQSWGPNSASGPPGDEYCKNLPPGGTPDNILGFGWWIPADVINRIVSSGDSFAYSDIDGWKIDKTDFTKIWGPTR